MHHREKGYSAARGCQCESCANFREKHRERMRNFTHANKKRLNAARRKDSINESEWRRRLDLHKKANIRYHEKHKDDPEYAARRRQEVRDSYRKHRKKRIAESVERTRRLRKEDPERIRRYAKKAMRKYYEDPAFIAVRNGWERKYRRTENGRMAVKANTQKRRARIREAPGECSREQLKARWEYYGGMCWICRAPAEHIDHVVAISRGGSNWPANLRPACGPCNLSKGAT